VARFALIHRTGWRLGCLTVTSVSSQIATLSCVSRFRRAGLQDPHRWLRQKPYIPKQELLRHKTPWPCGSTRRYCGPCRVFEQFGDVNPHCCRTGNLGLPLPERVASSLRLPPDAPGPPAARAVTHPDIGALFQPGAAIAVCVRPAVPPPMPRPDARNLPSRTAPAHIADSASGGQVGGGLAQPLPPRVDPLNHNGSCKRHKDG